MAHWDKTTLNLKPNHSWKAKPGCKIFVADRGAVRFDYPEEWVIVPGKKSIALHDAEPPKDECRLEISVFHLAPIDWSGLVLADLLKKAVKADSRKFKQKPVMHTVKRFDLEVAWTEMTFMDPREKRPARSRLLLAREATVQAFISFDYWPDDAERVLPAWNTMLETLELANWIEDPTLGAFIH